MRSRIVKKRFMEMEDTAVLYPVHMSRKSYRTKDGKLKGKLGAIKISQVPLPSSEPQGLNQNGFYLLSYRERVS